ncbi:hypothetical protein TDB9533_00989 [Thalassocella blandensis]|nr:hypothetical protein TDB9533_00989 [Thalassocella blandensis]
MKTAQTSKIFKALARRTAIFAGLLVLSACTANYTKSVVDSSLANINLADAHQSQRSADWVLHASTPMCLNKPSNRDEAVHNRSLIALHSALAQNLQQAFPSLTLAEASLPLDQAIKFARRSRCELLVNPALVKNKNHLNSTRELSEGKDLHPGREVKPDEVAISIEIYEARTGRLLDVAVLASEQKYFASHHKQPSDLYQDAVKRFVYSLTGRQPS